MIIPARVLIDEARRSVEHAEFLHARLNFAADTRRKSLAMERDRQVARAEALLTLAKSRVNVAMT